LPTVATVDEEIEFRAVQTASTSSVTRDFASQNISLRERDCHLPHGGRLGRNKFQHTHKYQFVVQILIYRWGYTDEKSSSITVGEGLAPPVKNKNIPRTKCLYTSDIF
jgi:hypothetical protein